MFVVVAAQVGSVGPSVAPSLGLPESVVDDESEGDPLSVGAVPSVPVPLSVAVLPLSTVPDGPLLLLLLHAATNEKRTHEAKR